MDDLTWLMQMQGSQQYSMSLYYKQRFEELERRISALEKLVRATDGESSAGHQDNVATKYEIKP